MQYDLSCVPQRQLVIASGGALFFWSAGIAVVQLLAELPGWRWLSLATLAGTMACWLSARLRNAIWRSIGVGLSVGLLALLAGTVWAVWRAELRLADSLPAHLEDRELLVTGAIESLPDTGALGTRLVLAVEQAETPDGVPVTVPTRVLLYLAGDGPAAGGDGVWPGQRWRFAVRLRRPHGEINPGGFDLETWMFQQDLRASGRVRAQPPPQQLAGRAGSWRTPVESLRAAVRARLQVALVGAPHAGVITGLAIGDQRGIATDAWALFAATGTSHLMSISGLHVTMLAGLAGALAGALWRRVPALVLRVPVRRVRVFAGVAAAGAYTLLAGAGIPAQRTLFMLAVGAVAMWSGGPVRPSRILLIALALVLAIDPWAVVTAGFWLSFSAVGVLLFAGAAAAQADTGWRGMLRGWGMAQWTVTLGTLPLTLWLFQQFSLVSPLANALAIPVVSALVAPLAVAAGLSPEPLAGWLAHASHAILVPLMIALEWLAGLSWSVWEQARPPWWAAMLGALGALCLLLPRGLPGRRIAWLLFVPLLAPPMESVAHGEARISLLDVGQGQATLVRTRGHVLMFDAGPARGEASDAARRTILPALRAIGVGRLDLLMVSHEDSDHAGGVASLLAGIPVLAWQSSIPDSHPLRALGPAHRPCVAGERWQWDGVDFAVLHPPARAYEERWESNARSCVLRIEAGGQRLLLTGDIEAPAEAVLAREQRSAVAAQFLQAPHHGSRTSSSEAFLDAVEPAHVLIPVGHRNRYRHPHPDVLARYAVPGREVWRTDRDGAIQVNLGPVPSVVGERRIRARYWHGR